MQKIIARMRGGLGNQLFILACAYYVKTLCREDVEIVLDTREYKTYKVRNFELLNMINDSSIRIYDDEIDSSIKYELSRKLFHVVQKFTKSNNSVSKILSNFGLVYSKRSAAGIENIKFSKDVFLYGYFQDARMTSIIKPMLLKRMSCTCPESVLEKDTAYISVSIRWGKDYIEQGWPICSSRYFVDGVKEIISEKYIDKKVCVLVFSDETEKARKLNFGIDTMVIDGLSAADQLRLMMNCSDYVISNSSFSWWGAFLGATDDSIVVAPNIWYDTKEPTEETLLQYLNVRIRGMEDEKS